MSAAMDIQQLDATGYAWYISRGKCRIDEPLYAVGLSNVSSDGTSSGDDFAFVTEADDLHSCVIRAVAWAEANPPANRSN